MEKKLEAERASARLQSPVMRSPTVAKTFLR